MQTESIIPSKNIINPALMLTGITRHFTVSGGLQEVFNAVEWTKTNTEIKDETGKVIFTQNDVEFPVFWSPLAITVTVNKYFRGKPGTPARETSLRQVIDRVVTTIVKWGIDQGYFDVDDAEIFEAELGYILLHQYAAFNSPVWFNLGVETSPQVSACFINSIEDTLDSIISAEKAEMILFKQGSGSGINFSPLRSSYESLSAGGNPSGPVSFMKGFDSNAGVVSSGGKTRRAAKMACLNIDHPDILVTANGGPGFITCKAEEEKKAHALVESGWSSDFTNPNSAYATLQFQNANNSVRVSDDFMKAVEDDDSWSTKFITTGQVHKTYKARDLFRQIAEAAWVCGDPGLQFDTTIHRWHTSKASGRINASNPCSEYMFLDDTACNLASMRLTKFASANASGVRSGTFLIDSFRHVINTLVIAQDILVSPAGYPTTKIADKNPKFRTIGLGFADLGAYLMSIGCAYDSPTGRAIAASISAFMTGQAYVQSANIAKTLGAFPEYNKNASAMQAVIHLHRDAAYSLTQIPDTALYNAAISSWENALSLGNEYGYRNAQVTVIAPTGTIGFMMDCDTTGGEPELALVKYKRLVGGGTLKLVNNTVAHGLRNLGYDGEAISAIVDHIGKTGTIEGAPFIKEAHLPVFDCSFKPQNGNRFIHWTGHVDMLAAIQPFISGSISKTINMPKDATVEDISDAYMRAWKKGLKCIAVYRDGCKASQPLNTVLDTKTGKRIQPPPEPSRKRLPDQRPSFTHKFNIGGALEGYLQIGFYPDTLKIGEIFINASKSGSTLRGLLDSFATQTSIALQYGVPFSAMYDKFSYVAFEPSGFTTDDKVKNTKSVIDYIFRFINEQFPDGQGTPESILGLVNKNVIASSSVSSVVDVKNPTVENPSAPYKQTYDAPPCSNCGNFMIRNGSCYKCDNCGTTSGCS